MPLTREDLQARLRAGSRSPKLDIRNVGDTTTVLLHDTIGDPWIGTDSGTFAQQIAEIDAPKIVVSINSPGGNIFDGIGIYNALRNHPAHVTTRVDGLAASIASVIAQAGDTRVMMGGSQMMIHNAWGLTIGDAVEMRKMAEVLDQQNLVIAEIYAAHSGADAADLLDLMGAETWMTATQAVESGLADSVSDGKAPSESSAAPVAELAGFDPALSLALLDL